MAYAVLWYRGVGEHGYQEFRRTDHTNLLDVFAELIRKYGEAPVLEAITGVQVDIAWITDILGFQIVEIEKVGQPVT